MRFSNSILALLLSLGGCLLVFLWQGYLGFSLRDEGLFWYQAQRTMTGEVPILDFASYDPGRYYWSATWMTFLGDDGILSLRIAMVPFQALALFIGLILLAQNQPKRDTALLITATLIFLLWMFPRHKVFDIGMSLFAIALIAEMLRRPEAKRFLLAGLGVGLIAVFGRNHGLYAAIGSLGALVYLWLDHKDIRQSLKQGSFFSGGVILGYSPILLMALFIPDFGQAYVKGILYLFHAKATNLGVPTPWPWRADIHQPFWDLAKDLLLGFGFMALLLFVLGGGFLVARRRKSGQPIEASLLATLFVGLPYCHYAFSRADLAHLSQSLFPLLLGSLLLLQGQTRIRKWGLLLSLLLASLWLQSDKQPGLDCLFASDCVELTIRGDKLMVPRPVAKQVNSTLELIETYAPSQESFLMVPYWPGAYAITGTKAPLWDIYPIKPRNRAFQEEELNRLQSHAPSFILISTRITDRRNELQYKYTNDLIYEYVQKNYRRLAESPIAKSELYLAKKVTP